MSGSARLYYDDAYTTRFEARIVRAGVHRDRPAVELESTFFYPEGGGQEADRGTIAGVPVVDVQADEQGSVWHVVGAPDALERGGEAPAEVDWARRFDHMQQHTGQHILSAALERELGAATLSSHLGEERSSLEVALPELDWKTVERLERAANGIVWEDREVLLHWVDDEGVQRFALRKPPKFTGRIRIVEIPEWDVSACGGTHTKRTGEVGVVKIVRWEKVRGNVRFEFLCGGRALRDYAWRTESLLEAARRRTLKDRELIAHLEKAAAERDQLAKDVRELTGRLVAIEAEARVGNPPRPVADWAERRTRDECRSLAIACAAKGAPWAVVAAGTPEPVIVAARPKGGTIDLKARLPDLLARARGKGGGSPELLQVSAADAGAAEDACRWLAEALESELRV